MSAAERNKSPEIDELVIRGPLLLSVGADASNMRSCHADRVSTEHISDWGTDESTIAAFRVGSAREAIDCSALTLLGHQLELSQRFGPSCGQAISLISPVLSHPSASTVCSQSEPSDRPACVETEAIVTSLTAM